MAVFYQNQKLPVFQRSVLTIGTFDGVHHGHRQILNEVVRYAKEIDGESIVVTFEPHPRKLLNPDKPIWLLTTLEQKIQLILEAGIHHVVVVPFTRAFSELSAQEYVEQFLVKQMKPHCIIIGYDHHFGYDRKGNIELLQSYKDIYSFDVKEIPAQLIDEATVSSTKIRNSLLEGRVEDAAAMLGRKYSIKGIVIKGNQLGRTIGYPTANIKTDSEDWLIPSKGVYAVHVQWRQKMLKGMMSIGFNPTVSNENKIHIEVNLFDFQEDIYGEELTIYFESYMRQEEKYSSLDALKNQLAEDKIKALSVLK